MSDQRRHHLAGLGDELEDGNNGEKSTQRLRIVSEGDVRSQSILHISNWIVLL